jgi:type II secretory pathway pseudopilin PulG
MRSTESGYAMVALLVAIALMSVFMSAVLPAWRHAAQREKEAELLWRGRQYDRAIQLFRRKHGTPGPPNVDALIEGKFLRKKYIDPISGGDFELRSVSPMGTTPGEGEQQPETSRRASRRRQRQTPASRPGRAQGQLIGGVRSKSKEKSILVLNGRQRYNEWDFAYVPYQDRLSQSQEQTSPNRPGISRSGRGPSGRSARPGTGSRRSPTRSPNPQ